MVGAFLILLVDPLQAFWFVVFLLVLQQIEGNLIYPRVVGKSVGLPGLWVLLSVTIGGSVFGMLGMLLSVPTLLGALYAPLPGGAPPAEGKGNRKKRRVILKKGPRDTVSRQGNKQRRLLRRRCLFDSALPGCSTAGKRKTAENAPRGAFSQGGIREESGNSEAGILIGLPHVLRHQTAAGGPDDVGAALEAGRRPWDSR